MDLDLEINTVLITFGFWAFILFLVWVIPVGFQGIKEKIIMTLVSLPLIYGIVVMQKNR